MSRLALYLFGSPKLVLDDAPVYINRRKATALLAYLAVTAQSHSRDSLATLLWPENGQNKARAELRRMLSTLTRALGSGWVIADRETVCLKTSSDLSKGRTFWLDITEFLGRLKDSETHKHPPMGTCPECLPALEEAVELYQDDFMAGFSLKECMAYDEWQFFQREELQGQLTNALVRLSHRYENTGEYETAIGYARRWLTLDPLHEPAHRQLMLLYDQSGKRAAAMRQFQTCQQTLSNELGVEPSEETRELYQSIRTSTLISSPDSRPKSNLPAQPTPFIGREKELAEIRAKLQETDCHLLTLLGPGGSGKTRLAIEVAGNVSNEFQHGVFFVNLAPLEHPERIPTTIAAALHFSFYEGGTPEEQLLDYLGNKELLLVLDNFEHLLAGAGFVSQILNACSSVKILATSRVLLMVTGEHKYDVWGMAFPESPVSLKIATEQYSAIKLFESEASRVQAAFQLDEDNLQDVIQVCTLLEGIPLGIILAAGWVELLTPKQIGAEITRNLEFLQTELVDVPQRHRGLRGVFNHSWQLLSDGEREIFSALSVFQGGFTQDGARIVTGASLHDLMRMAHKSILHRVSDDRYEVHQLLRQYAAEKIESDPASEKDIRRKHSDYYCQALIAWERELQGARQATARKEITLEIDNIRAAWAWAVENARIKTLFDSLNGLCIFFHVTRQREEGAATCQALVEMLEVVQDSDEYKLTDLSIQIDTLMLKARVLAWGCFLTWWLGEMDVSQKLTQNCLYTLEKNELATMDTRFERAVATLTFAFALAFFLTKEKSSQNQSIQFFKQAVALFDSLEEGWWMGIALYWLGIYTRTLSLKESIKNFEQSLAVRRTVGDLKGIADVVRMLSWSALYQLQFIEAEEMLQEALEIGLEQQDRHGIVSYYSALGVQWVWQGRFHQARSLLQETLEKYHDLVYTQSFSALLHIRVSFPELYLGEYQAARIQAQVALELYNEMKRFNASFNTGVTYEILGSIDLAERSYEEALKWFQESLVIFQNHNFPDKISKTQACLGYATRGLNEISRAQSHFYLALKITIEAAHYFPLTHALPGIALLFTDQGEIERAVELYALASTCGIVANSKWFADIAGDQIAKASEGLPAEVVKAAKTRGQVMDLWETAKVLLMELDELGWGSAGHQPESEPETEVG